MTRMIKLAILASTNGTDIKGIIAAIKSGELDASIAVVIANKECGAIQLAKDNDIPCEIVLSKGFEGSREEYDKKHPRAK